MRALFVTGEPADHHAQLGAAARGVLEARAAGDARYLQERDRLARALPPAGHLAAGAAGSALHFPVDARAPAEALSPGHEACRSPPGRAAGRGDDLPRSLPRRRRGALWIEDRAEVARRPEGLVLAAPPGRAAGAAAGGAALAAPEADRTGQLRRPARARARAAAAGAPGRELPRPARPHRGRQGAARPAGADEAGERAPGAGLRARGSARRGASSSSPSAR